MDIFERADSAILYMFVYGISALFYSNYKNNDHRLAKLSVFISVLIPSVFAGLRCHVGTDYDTYDWNFTYFRSVSWSDALHNNTHISGQIEYGFNILTKALSGFGNNKVIFGCIAFITVGFVARALMDHQGNCNISISYFMFLCIYFTNSFNIVRQSLAVAVIFYAMKFIYRSKPLKYFVCVAAATLLHFSSVAAIPIYFMWNHKKSRALSIKVYTFLFSVAVLAVLYWRKILQYLLMRDIHGIEKYARYFVDNEATNRDFYIKVLVLLLLSLVYFFHIEKDDISILFIQMGLINILIATTGFYITFIKRIGLVYELPVIVLVGGLARGFTAESRPIANVLSVSAVAAYFVLIYVIVGDSGVIPYTIK